MTWQSFALFSVLNKSHGSTYVFFFFNLQIRNLIVRVVSADDTITSCSAGNPLDEIRSIIDRNIARLEESIRSLKSRRNELSPISRLPAEILCNIFSLLEGNTVYGRPESWTNLSQVSQHWRSTALGAPELWTSISFSYPCWVQEMLIRSKKAKLTIQFGLSFHTSNPKIIETVNF